MVRLVVLEVAGYDVLQVVPEVGGDGVPQVAHRAWLVEVASALYDHRENQVVDVLRLGVG